MVTYEELSNEQKILLVNHLRKERVRLLTESRRKKAKRSTKKTMRLPNLQFKSPELKALFDNMTVTERNKLLS